MEKVINAIYIYEHIRENIGIKPTVICALHKPCLKVRRCTTPSKTQVLDFDKVQMEWHKEHRLPSTKSVDALTYKHEILCFVEVKGWKDYLEWNKIVVSESEDLEKKKENFRKDIEEKTENYGLQKKLIESIKICEEIVETKDLQSFIPIQFILVSDVDIRTDAIGLLTSQLMMLGTTSTNWETVCVVEMKKSLIRNIKNIKSRFICCNSFDDYIASL